MPLDSLLPLCCLEFAAQRNMSYSPHLLSINSKIQRRLSTMCRMPRLMAAGLRGEGSKSGSGGGGGGGGGGMMRFVVRQKSASSSPSSPLGRFVYFAAAAMDVSGDDQGVELDQEGIELVEMGSVGVGIVDMGVAVDGEDGNGSGKVVRRKAGELDRGNDVQERREVKEVKQVVTRVGGIDLYQMVAAYFKNGTVAKPSPVGAGSTSNSQSAGRRTMC